MGSCQRLVIWIERSQEHNNSSEGGIVTGTPKLWKKGWKMELVLLLQKKNEFNWKKLVLLVLLGSL